MSKYSFLLVLLVCLLSRELKSSDDSQSKDIVEKTAEYFVGANAVLYLAGNGVVVGMTKALASAPLNHCIPSMKSMHKDVLKAIVKKSPLTGALSFGVAVMNQRT